MISKGSIPRTVLTTAALMLALFFSCAPPAASQQSDLQKAKDLINAGEFEAGINLLEGYIAKIKDIANQKKSIAEAYYLIAKIYFSVGEDEKSAENLTSAFIAYPGFSVEEPNVAFRVSVERVRALTAQRQREEKAEAEAKTVKLTESAKAQAPAGNVRKSLRFKVLGAFCFSDSSETNAFGQPVSSFYKINPAPGVGFEFGSGLVLDIEVWLIPKSAIFNFDIPAIGDGAAQFVDVYISRWEISLPIMAKLYVSPSEAKLRPFIMGGFEIAKVTWNLIDVMSGGVLLSKHGLSKPMDYGLILGLGTDFGLGARTSIFLEGRLQIGLVKLDNGSDFNGPDASRPYLLGIFTGIKF